MKKIILGLACLSASLYAKQAAQPAEHHKISYDTDLFRENKKIFFFNVEFLYWTADESALDYAVRMKNHPAWGDPTDGVGHYKIVDFNWSPGFRMNVGYFNAPHYWDTYLQYTYFKSKGQDETHAPGGTDLYLNGTWPQPNQYQAVALEKARSSIELELNLLDGMFTRRFHPNPHLRMRLYGGPTVAWIRQNWEIDYRDLQTQVSHLHNHWRFTGAGIRAGYLVDWFLGKGGFYFTGLFSAAVYAGSYHNVSKQTSSQSVGDRFDTSLPFRNVHYHDVRLIPHFQIFGGASWQMAFDRIRTELFIGYEFNFWTNLHEVYRTSSGEPQQAKLTNMSNSVLGLQGLTVRWNLDF